MFTIVDRYIVSRLAVICVLALLVFTIVWLAPEIMLDTLGYIGTGKLTLIQGLWYLLYQIPEVLIYSIPIAAMIASLFFFQRLHASFELTAMFAAGISLKRLYVPVCMVGAMLMALFVLNQELLKPIAAEKLKELNIAAGIQKMDPADRYVTLSEKDSYGGLKRFILYAKHPAQNENAVLEVLLKATPSDRWISTVTSAKSGYWNDNTNMLTLEKGTVYHIDEQGVYRHQNAFTQEHLSVDPAFKHGLTSKKRLPIEMSTHDLATEVHRLQTLGEVSEAMYLKVRLWQRFVQPLAPVVFLLLAIGIGIEGGRRFQTLGLVFAALLLVLYHMSTTAFTIMGSIGLCPTLFAAITPTLLVCVVGIQLAKIRPLAG